MILEVHYPVIYIYIYIYLQYIYIYNYIYIYTSSRQHCARVPWSKVGSYILGNGHTSMNRELSHGQ